MSYNLLFIYSLTFPFQVQLEKTYMLPKALLEVINQIVDLVLLHVKPLDMLLTYQNPLTLFLLTVAMNNNMNMT